MCQDLHRSLRRINEFSHELSLAPLRQLCSTRNKRERDKKKLRKKGEFPCRSREYISPKANNANLNKAVARLSQL